MTWLTWLTWLTRLTRLMTWPVNAGAVYDVKTSVVEIYCERIRDLLDPGQENLQVKQDSSGSIFIEGRHHLQYLAVESAM
jgi:hypothetical protein